jgi:cell division septum initiation protein DivIVA
MNNNLSFQQKLNTKYYYDVKIPYPGILGKKYDDAEILIKKSFIGTFEEIQKEIERVKTEIKAEYDKTRRDIWETENRLKEEFKRDIEEDYGTGNNSKKDLLFNKAWEMGHGNGYNSVKDYYDNLVDLIL